MREQRKRLIGTVMSDKMDKTIVVAVTTVKQHPRYKKTIRLTKKYKAHDEANECKAGDRVQIIESKPISRHKRWSVMEILERAN